MRIGCVGRKGVFSAGAIAVLMMGLLFVSQAFAAAAFTAGEVAQHSSASDCWFIIDGMVYDVTAYIPYHPGGQAAILSYCGNDATAAFGGVGHSSNAQSQLQGYYVGDLVVPPPADVTPPVITVLGQNPVNLFAGTAYADAGATAFDNVDGNLTAAIISASNVNASIAGTYAVTYTVSDASGNLAMISRTVRVLPLGNVTPPVTPPVNNTHPRINRTWRQEEDDEHEAVNDDGDDDEDDGAEGSDEGDDEGSRREERTSRRDDREDSYRRSQSESSRRGYRSSRESDD